MAARDAAFDLDPFLLVDQAGTPVIPVLPGIGSGAQHLPMPITAQHGASRHVDRGQACARGTHQQGGRGLVTTAQEHDAIDRVAAQKLLDIHRQEVAIQHRCRLDVLLRQGQRRQFDRKAACLEHTTLDVLDPMLEMGVAWVDVGPRIHNADQRLARPVFGPVAHLHGARAMAERAQIIGREPACAAQSFGGFDASAHGRLPDDNGESVCMKSMRNTNILVY